MSLSSVQAAKIAERFQEYERPHCLDPFKKIHWGTVTSWEKGGAHVISQPSFGFAIKSVKSSTQVKDFTDAVLTTKLPGEHDCLAFYWSDKEGMASLVEYLREYASSGLWFRRVNQEVSANRPLMTALKCRHLSSTVTGVGSDIYGIHYAGPRILPQVSDTDSVCFQKLPVKVDSRAVLKGLAAASPDFQAVEIGSTVYGGKGKTWKQVFLQDRGEPWQVVERHELCQRVPEIVKALKSVCSLDRLACVMLTRVTPGGHILRHRDVKNCHGLGEGQRMRIHIVLQAEQATFSMWDLEGVKTSVEMCTGEVWYSDVRKPHEIENRGHCDRLHLAIDVLGGRDLLEA